MTRLPAMLVGPDADDAAVVAAHVALAGIAMAGGSPALADMDDETLRRHLADAGRRLLGRPRRRARPRRRRHASSAVSSRSISGSGVAALQPDPQCHQHREQSRQRDHGPAGRAVDHRPHPGRHRVGQLVDEFVALFAQRLGLLVRDLSAPGP